MHRDLREFDRRLGGQTDRDREDDTEEQQRGETETTKR